MTGFTNRYSFHSAGFLALFGLCAQLFAGCADQEAKLGGDPLAKEKQGPEQGVFAIVAEDSCENPCTFSVQSTAKLTSVIYEADGWELGESFDTDKGFQLPYTFNSFGARKIRAIGISGWGERAVEAFKTVTVTQANDRVDTPRGENNGNSGGLPNVPYFNQYNNRIAPGSSCQNTSIAMVLAYLGWGGVPDDITQSYGKDMAQSPAGLARLFNIYASRAGLSMEIKPNTSGTFSGLRAELDRGHPVIIHGYFTGYGHVLVVLGYDEGGYYVNDPAGRWSGVFKGGYSGGGSGAEVYYNKAAFEAAVGTSNGYNPLPLWYHALR